MSQEKHYEMQWDCQFCGATKLLGKTHRFCPTCGAPQNPDSRYFPSDEDKVAVEDHEFVGKDKLCPACGGLNSGAAIHCGNCGSNPEKAETARTLNEDGWMEEAAVAGFQQSRDVAGEKFERDMAAAGIETTKAAAAGKSGGSRRVGIIIAVLVVAGIIGAIFLFTRTQEQTVLVSGHEWERRISVEEYRAVSDGDWRDSLPAGAYNRSCSEKQRDTRRVQDGETCRTVRRDNGDGTFSERQECEPKYREEPVMDTWCDYTIDRWEDDTAIVTRGTGLASPPTWGETNFGCTNERLGCQRESGRNETYTVLFSEDGNTHKCNFSQSEWENIAVESRWTMEVRQFVGGAVCNSLAPQ
jgi:hypothetical protein